MNRESILRPRRIRLIAALTVGGIAAIAIASGRFDPVAFRDSVDGFGAAAPIVFVLSGTVLMSVCVPKTVMSMIAGALFGIPVGAMAMLAAAMLAATINYVIGYRFLAGSIDRLRGRGDQRVAMLIDIAGGAGFWLHLMIRLSPIPTMLVSYTCGAVRSRIVPCLAAVAVAVGPQVLWIAAAAGTVEVLQGDTPMPRGAMTVSIAVTVLAAIGLMIVLPREAMRRIRLRQATKIAAAVPDAPSR